MTSEWQFSAAYVRIASLVRFFSKDDHGHAISVNGERYRAMVDTFLRLEIKNNDLEDHWF